MIKYIAILLVFVSNTAYSIEYGNYIGGMYGTSNLNYDVEAQAYEYLVEDENAATANSIINALDGDLNVSSDSTSSFSKYFIGRRFSKNYGLELFYAKFNKYTAKAAASARISPNSSVDTHLANASVAADANFNAEANAAADLKGYGLRINGYLQMTKNLEFIAGFGIMKAKARVSTTTNIAGDWSYVATGDGNQHDYFNTRFTIPSSTTDVSGQGNYRDTKTKKSLITATVPVFSLGLLYNITTGLSVRTEVEMYGLPVNGLSIIALTAGAQYTF